MDTVGIFETVLGPRRGHTRGIGPRPYPRESFPQPANDGTPPPQLTQVVINLGSIIYIYILIIVKF